MLSRSFPEGAERATPGLALTLGRARLDASAEVAGHTRKWSGPTARRLPDCVEHSLQNRFRFPKTLWWVPGFSIIKGE